MKWGISQMVRWQDDNMKIIELWVMVRSKE